MTARHNLCQCASSFWHATIAFEGAIRNSETADDGGTCKATMMLQDDDSDNDSINSNYPYFKIIQFRSIRNRDGLEEAISVCWSIYPDTKLSDKI